METVKKIPEKGNSSASAISNTLYHGYIKMAHHPIYKWLTLLLGFPVTIVVFLVYINKRQSTPYQKVRLEVENALKEEQWKVKMKEEYVKQIFRKRQFFNQRIDDASISEEGERWAREQYIKIVNERTDQVIKEEGIRKPSYDEYLANLFYHPLFLALTFMPGVLMYSCILLFSNAYVKYITERLVWSFLVIIGVAFFVFTILYISPFNPAANILGEAATKEQIASFNQIYGLDKPYFVQLWNSIKGILTFDLGRSFSGNEDVAASIMRRFPITMVLAIISLLMAIMIAIPIGIISATRPNSFFDYTFMFIALLGLSIPNFWQGLIFILNFSIKLQWLPATFSPSNWLSIVMPAVVLGTALTASIARMTRSSTLEIINEDYIVTAKAKGLNKRQVLWKHAVGNAMIPIITVIGLLFGGMLGGAAVTEKVFNISGIGSFIVDKQFIPDIPSVMGGVVYIAITISLVNLLIDVLYAFFDPRIRTKMKQY